MNETASLERGYRRVLACYPKSFRRENGDEILAVLVASAKEGQHRVGLAECAALTRGGCGCGCARAPANRVSCGARSGSCASARW